MHHMSPATLEDWVRSLAVKLGYGGDDAAFLAETLVDANACGIDSHGVIRLPVYARRIEHKLVHPAASPSVTITGATVTVDAQGTPGQTASHAAMKALLGVSQELGTASALVRGSAHFGTAGFYARWLAHHDCIGFVVSNSESIVVPHGGVDAVLGTNPIAFAAPMNGVPLSLDMATSTSAMGKVMVAQAHGNTIPDSWGVNAGGHRTTRPDEVIALLPLGGAKGYGLGVLVEILGGVLTGASIAKDIGNMYKDFDRPQNVGHYMLAIHIPHFMPIDIFKERMGVLASMLRSSRTAPGVEGIMIPGEPEEKVRQQRHQEGIPLADVTVQELTELGQQYGVPFPPPLQTSPQQEHT